MGSFVRHLFKDYSKMLSVCCFCVPLRNGSITLAVLGVLAGLGSFGQGYWPSIVCGIISLAYGGCLLFGAIKYHEKAVLVALIMQGVNMAISALFFIIILASIGSVVPTLANDCEDLRIPKSSCDEVKSATIGPLAGIFIGSILLNVYFWICNYSFHKELKEGVQSPEKSPA